SASGCRRCNAEPKRPVVDGSGGENRSKASATRPPLPRPHGHWQGGSNTQTKARSRSITQISPEIYGFQNSANMRERQARTGFASGCVAFNRTLTSCASLHITFPGIGMILLTIL
ncbi:MAG TPA: hypothetical protein VFT58_06960, partial [Nitrososphaera sp.]|nr:hypothetical protein [Nitrososphaera sp.]